MQYMNSLFLKFNVVEEAIIFYLAFENLVKIVFFFSGNLSLNTADLFHSFSKVEVKLCMYSLHFVGNVKTGRQTLHSDHTVCGYSIVWGFR